ncbi:MAG: Na/Pi cotransporter family protein [Clostridia bacterium]|nr:Na/Pi cotransporter family protein [Clostridia bacterium]
MSIFDVLQLLCGLALFLYGMNVMGDALKKSAGKSLKTILATLTSSTFKGFMLGLLVTMVIQSSSATTVMVVGFVNSGTMTLTQAIGVIMGANVGTAVTAWITGLSGLGEGGQAASAVLQWLKPDSWMPILAVIGICLTMFAKRERKKDIGVILLGFAVLMVGMDLMSGAVAGLKSSEEFKSILTMFENPILGILAGLVLTAIVQSSSASVGILQSLTTTGAITYGAAIPIIMGQNIGTCVTAMLSSMGASKNAKRAALAHLYFNVIGVIFWMSAYSILHAIFHFAFADAIINMWGVAGVHTIFKILSVILIAPFGKQLEKLATLSVKDSKEEENLPMLEERLLDTPTIAVESAKQATAQMAVLSCEALRLSLKSFTEYDDKLAEQIRAAEDKADIYEDMIGSYLIKLSAKDMNAMDSHEITKLLHIIGDFERISDHSVNILESAEEMRDKKLEFSNEAKHELKVLSGAIDEIVQLAQGCFTENDFGQAAKVEPLEEVVDYLKDQIKLQHVLRLQKSECSIEHGFVLADILNNMERVADHCSNIAGCVIEISQHDSLSMHSYLSSVRAGGEEFDRVNREYMRKYSLKHAEE